MKKIKTCNYEILNFEQDPLVPSMGATNINNKGIFHVLKVIVKRKGQAVTRVRLKGILKKMGRVAPR